MKTRVFVTMLVASLTLGGYSQQFDITRLHGIKPADYRQGEVLVKFKGSSDVNIRRNAKGKFSPVPGSSIDRALQQIGADDMEALMPLSGKTVSPKRVKSITGNYVNDTDLSKLYLLKFTSPEKAIVTSSNPVRANADIEKVITSLQQLDEVEYAEPNFIVESQSITGWGSNDPLYGQQWGFTSANISNMWFSTSGKENILGHRPVIAIVDTGVDITHPDLADNIWTNTNEESDEQDNDGNGYKDDLHGWDFVNQTGVIGDYNGHGTHCAGIAAAVGDNGIGVVGANPEALIMPVTVLQSNGVGDVATIIKGIDYAAANGADVISMSIGGYSYSIAEEQALAKAYSKSFIVAAAGNNALCVTDIHEHFPTPKPMYPAAFTFVLGVQATGENGSLASFSNYDDDGPLFSEYNEERLYNYEVSAPGCNILSTYPGGRYATMNGTSMACPLVAGVASRILQYKEINSHEILFGDFIYTSASLFKAHGGLIDAAAAFDVPETSRKPNLHLISVEYADSLGGKDQDGRIDAGEIIDIYPTFRNDWGETYGGVTVHLDFADNEDQTLGEFIQNDVPLGCDLSSYGKAKSTTPVRLKLRDDIVDGRTIKLTATAECFNMSDEYKPDDFTFNVENGVELGGTQEHDITLYPGIQYIVTRNWGIPKDVVVTVKPGTTIKIKDNVGISNYGNMLFEGKPDSMITVTKADLGLGNIGGFLNDNAKVVDFNYVIFDNLCGVTFNLHNYNNCIIRNCIPLYSTFTENATFRNCEIYNNMVSDPYFVAFCPCHSVGHVGWFSDESTFIQTSIHDNIFNHGFGTAKRFYQSNYIGNETLYTADSPSPETLESSNCFGNYFDFKSYAGNPFYKPGFYSVIFDTTEPEKFYLSNAYVGTANEDVAKAQLMDEADNIGWGHVYFDQMLKEAVYEAPVCVDYVKIDGINPLDEESKMLPLGIGTHTVTVGFNREMDKSVKPFITMGVRPPYTQNNLDQDETGYAQWFNDYTYRTKFTITTKTATDGTNRIRVADYKQKGQDPEFRAPIEKYRYDVQVSGAGSMSTGMMAEAGLGKVTLTWTTDSNDFDDLLGYNLYRFTYDGDNVCSDTLMINKNILEASETSYVDYDVTPGQTYCYFIREIGTDLMENDASATVAAIPLTAEKGDANGDLTVDISDVLTEVTYLSNGNPQPFIFDAADVNSDGEVNILDVVATLRKITAPETSESAVEDEQEAYCYIDNGHVIIESPVVVGGIQILTQKTDEGEGSVAFGQAVKEMEQLQAAKNDQQQILLAYSMSGKVLGLGSQDVLTLNDGMILKDIILCTPRGNRIRVVYNKDTAIEPITAAKGTIIGIYDLTGRRLSQAPQHGAYIQNGKIRVK